MSKSLPRLRRCPWPRNSALEMPYIWGFVGGHLINDRRADMTVIPARTPESRRPSSDLQKHGFKFVGPTIC